MYFKYLQSRNHFKKKKILMEKEVWQNINLYFDHNLKKSDLPPLFADILHFKNSVSYIQYTFVHKNVHKTQKIFNFQKYSIYNLLFWHSHNNHFPNYSASIRKSSDCCDVFFILNFYTYIQGNLLWQPKLISKLMKILIKVINRS